MSSPHQTVQQHQHPQSHQSMSSDKSKKTNLSNFQTNSDTPQVPVPLPPQLSVDTTSSLLETQQLTAARRSQSTPPISGLDRHSVTSHPRQESSLIYIYDPRTTTSPSDSLAESSEHRQGRSLVARHPPRSSSSQPPRTVLHPYTRPTPPSRAHSQTPPVTMSSASTPSNTSTAGSGSGSNPSYQLPYAPFPYPAPANAGQGGKGNGK